MSTGGGDGGGAGGGLVRRARRPAGWRAPGPPPATPPDRPDLWPGPGEDLCHLAGDWRILQRVDGHRWSLDDLVTAHLAAEVAAGSAGGADGPALAVDLGCGIGTVLLLLAWRFPAARVVGIEAQALSSGLARRSIAWNGAHGRCEVRDGDLREPAILADLEGRAALVTGTPPYFPRGKGSESDRPQRAPCRLEHRGGVEVYLAAAARLLAPGGAFVACEGAGQRRRVEDAVAAAGLVLEAWREVVPREGKAPLLSLFACRAPGGAGLPARVPEGRASPAPACRPPLVVRDRQGRWTPELRAIRAEMGLPCPV